MSETKTGFFRIECSKCGDIIETTARTFAWPYVCEECEAATSFAKDIAPVDRTSQTVQAESELTHDSATVENTTLLIEDLEAQVSASAKALEDANSLITDMNETINHWVKRVNELSIVCEEKDILMGLLVRELRERRRKHD